MSMLKGTSSAVRVGAFRLGLALGAALPSNGVAQVLLPSASPPLGIVFSDEEVATSGPGAYMVPGSGSTELGVASASYQIGTSGKLVGEMQGEVGQPILRSGPQTGLTVVAQNGVLYSSRFGVSQVTQSANNGDVAELEVSGDLRSADGQSILGTYQLALGVRGGHDELRGIVTLDLSGPIQSCFLTLRPEHLGASSSEWMPTEDGLYTECLSQMADPVTGEIWSCRAIADPGQAALVPAGNGSDTLLFLGAREDEVTGERIHPFSLQRGS